MSDKNMNVQHISPQKVIFHIDVNSAFLSWEAANRLRQDKDAVDLRNIPSAIGGDVSKRHGIILAKSIPAKRYGVQTGESVMEALKKCPNLYLAAPNFKIYKESSQKFMNILREYSPDVEQCSIDEAFVDVSGTRRLFGEPIELAHTIKDRVREELGFTVNVGISDVKLLAKVASDFKKPDLVHTLFKSEIKTKMWPLPVEDLMFVGKATKKKLLSMGIRTIGELANTDVGILKSNLKSHGELIWNFANGVDFSIVDPIAEPNKGYGNSTTIAYDIKDSQSAKMVLLSLSEKVAARLRLDNVKGELVTVTIKNTDLESKTHQKMAAFATNITTQIHKTACELFDELWDGTPIRHLGVSVSHLKESTEARQISFFEKNDFEKLEAADKLADDIRRRFGQGLVVRAAFVNKSNNEKDDYKKDDN